MSWSFDFIAKGEAAAVKAVRGFASEHGLPSLVAENIVGQIECVGVADRFVHVQSHGHISASHPGGNNCAVNIKVHEIVEDAPD